MPSSSTVIEVVAILTAAGFAIAGATADYFREKDRRLRWRLGVLTASIAGLLALGLLYRKGAEQLEQTRAANLAKDSLNARLDSSYARLGLLQRVADTTRLRAESLIGRTDSLMMASRAAEIQLASITKSAATASEFLVRQSNLLDTQTDQLVRQTKTSEGILTQTSEIARGATDILLGINKSLYPVRDVRWAYEVRLNLAHPHMQQLRDRLRNAAAVAFVSRPGFGDDLEPGSTVTVGVPDHPGVSLFRRYGQRSRLLVRIDSPLLADAGDALGAVLGYEVLVDIFRTPPTPAQLADRRFRSESYAITLLPPYAHDTYLMHSSADDFPAGHYRSFELIYVPEQDGKEEEGYVDYYWNALRGFDVLTEPSEASFVGLPDFRGTHYVIRVATVPDYWGASPPYFLEFLRMRVGEQELFLEGQRLEQTRTSTGHLVYQMKFPEDLEDLIRMFLTIRSTYDVARQ